MKDTPVFKLHHHTPLPDFKPHTQCSNKSSLVLWGRGVQEKFQEPMVVVVW